jgi:hypothetical protein
MAKVSLRASGGLNKDFDPNNLPEGDYSSASNIVFDFGKSGGAGAIRLLESIRTSGVSATNIKATTQGVDGTIYVLGDNGSTASIYKIPTTLDTKTTLVTYTHLVATTFVPDLKIIGTSIVWNYAEEGTVLICPTTDVIAGTRTILDLKLQKDTPNNVVGILKTIGTGIDFLESNDFQFASRYQYTNKEYSVLGNYSQVFKGEKGTASYSLTYTFGGSPYFATHLEVYVRIGNNGIWRRIDTQLISAYSGAFTWLGQTYESLDIVTTGNPYDAVPVNAKHIEIAKNRIFLANIKDDYDMSSANLDFTLSSASGYTLPSSGLYNSYISGSPLTTPTSSETGSDYVKPFANNSVYGVGIAFYDSALKTRGVEKFEKITTGKFAYPMIPTITVTLNAGYVKPSWAKYAQLVYTKNTSKSYFYEGYASNIYFQLNQVETNLVTKETTDILVASQSVTVDQLKDIKYFVIDLMGMYRAGQIYTVEQGDRVLINTPNGLLDLRILGQENNLIYCEYSGIAMTNISLPNSTLLYFEIYSPKQVQEDESLVFYEYGNLTEISAWAASTTKTFSGTGTLNGASTAKLIGDTVFTKIELPVYKTAPFLYNTQRTVPAVIGAGIDENVITVINANINSLANSTAGSGSPTDKTDVPTIVNISPNGDSSTIVDSSSAFKLAGFYDIGVQKAGTNRLTIAYNLTATKVFVLNGGGAVGSATWSLKAQVFRTPYNNTTNKYDVASEKIGKSFDVFPQATLTADTGGGGTIEPALATQIIELNTGITKPFEANDKFHIELALSLVSTGDVTASQITISKTSGSTYGINITLNGNRTTPKTITTYNNNATVETTNVKYLIRSISNATSNQFWNTSAGKPSIISTSSVSTRRTNTIRYGGNYVSGTNINNTCSFFALDSNDVAIENGEITSLQRASRLQGNGSMLLVLCQKESAYIMMGEQELSQGNNSSVYALTANMIGTIRNFGNNLGMLNKQSVMNYKGNIWWWDDFNKKVVKYTPDGLEIPSDTYMRSHFLTKSGVANFSYDPFYNMCFVAIGSDTTSAGYSDNLKRWIAESYNLKSDFAESYGDKIILFKSGVMYKPIANTTTNDYNHLLGTEYNGSITFTLNSRLPINPLNVSVTHDMNVVDYSVTSNYVKANLLTIGITNENGQATSIVESNFLVEDNRLYAHILRDANSQRGGVAMPNAIIEGDYIVGYLNKFVVTLKDKSQNMRINSIDVDIAPVSGHS